MMYATIMDEIAKIITRNNLGITVNDNSKIGRLLWIDDMALIVNKEEEMQEMLDITNEIAEDYRITFGKEKSKVWCMYVLCMSYVSMLLTLKLDQLI